MARTMFAFGSTPPAGSCRQEPARVSTPILQKVLLILGNDHDEREDTIVISGVTIGIGCTFLAYRTRQIQPNESTREESIRP